MHFTLAVVAAALLLTSSVEPQAASVQNLNYRFHSPPPPPPNPGAACTSDAGCYGGLRCFYNPTNTGFSGPSSCYPMAQLGHPCNFVGPNYVLCGEAQECGPGPNPSSGNVCREVPTIKEPCQLAFEPIKNWCDDGQVCDGSTTSTAGGNGPTCVYPKYRGDACDPAVPSLTVCVGGGMCNSMPGARGYDTCTGGTPRPF